MQFVLSESFVIQARKALEAIRTHEQIVMYLAIQRQAAKGFKDGVISTELMYEDLKKWLTVPGGSKSQYYRPFTSRGQSFWMNNNLQGSYARSSLRGASKAVFYSNDGELRKPTADEIGEVLLKNRAESRVPCWAAAGFLFRNALFSGSKAPKVSDLIDLFKKYFAIFSEDQFSSVFSFDSPDEISKLFEQTSSLDELQSETEELSIIDPDYRLLSCNELEIEEGFDDASLPMGKGFLSLKPSDSIADVEREIIDALGLYSGVILSGSPGTSKSYYAERVACLLTEGDYERMAFTQFHASYQFEDFIQGYIPDPDKNGFKINDGIFLSLCKQAMESDEPYVIVIDELSRGDSCRIFGEALTYIEASKRGKTFYLPSGEQTFIPKNVFIIATMNPIDKGADEVDVAFGRRFATIEMEPKEDLLRTRLEANNLDISIREELITWFKAVNRACKQLGIPGLGHAYFWNVTDENTLRQAWKYQVKAHLYRSFGLYDSERDALIGQIEGWLNPER